MILEKDKSRIYRVCMHEAAHIVIANLYSYGCIDMSITFSNFEHSGAAEIDLFKRDIDTFEKLESHLRERIQILYAGVIAESINLETEEHDMKYALDQWKNGGGVDDHKKIRELTRIYRNFKYPKTDSSENAVKELKELDDELITITGNLVFEHLDKIKSLADKIFAKVNRYDQIFSLSKDEIADALKEQLL